MVVVDAAQSSSRYFNCSSTKYTRRRAFARSITPAKAPKRCSRMGNSGCSWKKFSGELLRPFDPLGSAFQTSETKSEINGLYR